MLSRGIQLLLEKKKEVIHAPEPSYEETALLPQTVEGDLGKPSLSCSSRHGFLFITEAFPGEEKKKRDSQKQQCLVEMSCALITNKCTLKVTLCEGPSLTKWTNRQPRHPGQVHFSSSQLPGGQVKSINREENKPYSLSSFAYFFIQYGFKFNMLYGGSKSYRLLHHTHRSMCMLADGRTVFIRKWR